MEEVRARSRALNGGSHALVGMSAKGKEMSDDEKGRTAEAIAKNSADAIRRYSDGVSLAFDPASNVAIASA